MRRTSWGWAAVLFAGLGGCGDDDASGTDAGVSSDAGPGASDGGRFPACAVDASTAISVTGIVAELNAACETSVGEDWQVCRLDHPESCDMSDIIGAWRIPGLPNDEIVLRFEKVGEVPRLLPMHPHSCTYDSYVFALPTRVALDSYFAGIGGYDPTKAYAVVFAQTQRVPPTTSPPICEGNVAGVTVTSTVGSVYYANAPGTAFDPMATTTTTSGLAVVVVDGAPALGAAPQIVRLTARRTASTPHCQIGEGNDWVRGDPASETEFSVDAPLLAGHITYPMFLACDAP